MLKRKTKYIVLKMLLEKRESSTKNSFTGLVEGLYLFSI